MVQIGKDTGEPAKKTVARFEGDPPMPTHARWKRKTGWKEVGSPVENLDMRAPPGRM